MPITYRIMELIVAVAANNLFFKSEFISSCISRIGVSKFKARLII